MHYELTRQVHRSLRFIWPTSEGHLYREQKRLVTSAGRSSSRSRTVYLGRAGDGPPVAVKVLRPELAGDPSFLRMFRHEVAAARRVVGFCTARVLDADSSGELPYLVTEYVEGVRLDRAIAASGRLAATDLEGLAVAWPPP